MSRVSIRPASHWDALEMAPSIRKADEEEVQGITGQPIDEALLRAVMTSDAAWTVTETATGDPIALFGVAPGSEPGVGIPWMLCTDKARRFSREYVRETTRYVAFMHSLYPVLVNLVDTRNHQSIRWLRWAGFEFPERIELGGITVYKFMRISDV